MAEREKLNKSPEGMKQMVGHHLPYEINMMRHMYLMLLDGRAALWINQGVVNALIESFCVHGRALLEFFEEVNTSPTDNTAAARHFTKPSYVPFPNGAPSHDLRQKLNAQIAHLSYSRSDQSEHKMSPKDRQELMQFIDDEIENFEREIKDVYKPEWVKAMSSGKPVTGPTIKAGPVGPSNDIGILRLNPMGWTGPSGPPREFRYDTDPKQST